MLERAKDYLDLQIGSYRLLRLLGEGTFSQVYLGEHIYLKTQSAVKLLRIQLSPEVRDNFLHEAQTIARLEHPNIIRVFDYGFVDETPFLVMNYAPNGSLRQRYPVGTRLTLEEILPILKQIAPALDYAHQSRLIHRDVKPENILIGSDDQMFLSDFGLVLEAQSHSSQTLGKAAGTVLYMAPEQFQGNVRFASDQYALGIIAYQWLCGQCPFNGTFAEIISQHLYTPMPSLSERVPGIAPIIDRILLKALAKDPTERYESTVDFVNALQKAFDSPLAHIELYNKISGDPDSALPSDVSVVATVPPLAAPGRTLSGIPLAQNDQPTALDQESVVVPLQASGPLALPAEAQSLTTTPPMTPFWRLAVPLIVLFLLIGGSLGLWYDNTHSSAGTARIVQTPPTVLVTRRFRKTPASSSTAPFITVPPMGTITASSGTDTHGSTGSTPVTHPTVGSRPTTVAAPTSVPPISAGQPTVVADCLSGSPTNFVFISYKKLPDPDPGVVTLTNCGGSSGWNASVQTSDGNNWLSVSPASGSLTLNNSEEIAVTVGHNGLQRGTYQGSILFSHGSASVTVTVINVVRRQ